DERGGHVFDVERRVYGIGKSPGSAAESAMTESAMDDSGNGFGFEIVHQVEGKVEEVNADIEQNAAAGEFLLSEPCAEFRNSGPAKPVAFRVVNVAEIAAFNEKFGA